MASSARSSHPRKAKRVVFYGHGSSWIPGVKSDDTLHKLINKLNEQSFPQLEYGDIDDTLVYLLFAGKKNRRWNAIIPERSSKSRKTPIHDRPELKTRIQAASQDCLPITHPGADAEDKDIETTCKRICVLLFEQYEFMKPDTPLRRAVTVQ